MKRIFVGMGVHMVMALNSTLLPFDISINLYIVDGPKVLIFKFDFVGVTC